MVERMHGNSFSRADGSHVETTPNQFLSWPANARHPVVIWKMPVNSRVLLFLQEHSKRHLGSPHSRAMTKFIDSSRTEIAPEPQRETARTPSRKDENCARSAFALPSPKRSFGFAQAGKASAGQPASPHFIYSQAILPQAGEAIRAAASALKKALASPQRTSDLEAGHAGLWLTREQKDVSGL
jgi:hypothetical protein